MRLVFVVKISRLWARYHVINYLVLWKRRVFPVFGAQRGFGAQSVKSFNETKVESVLMNIIAIQIHTFSTLICWINLLLIPLKPGQTRSLWLRLVYKLFVIEHNSNINFTHSSGIAKVKPLLNLKRNSQFIKLPLLKSYSPLTTGKVRNDQYHIRDHKKTSAFIL